MQIAKEILNQLGGNRFAVMTGSNQFIAGENSLTMKLKRNKTKANYLRITLNSLDTYDMNFTSIRGESIITKKEVNGIYNDQLQEIFTEATGLYTKL